MNDLVPSAPASLGGGSDASAEEEETAIDDILAGPGDALLEDLVG